jgi:membrane associated rhomboid family serine protease
MREFRPMGNTLFPPVVKNLLIINGILFFATTVFKNNFPLTDLLALTYFESPKFKVWQLVTHLFMHGDIGHLFSNMFSLWIFGATVENYLGSKKFLQYYLLTGLLASVLYTGVQYIEIHPVQEHAIAYEINPNYQSFKKFVEEDISKTYQANFVELVDAYEANPNDTEIKRISVNAVNSYAGQLLNSKLVGASGAVFGILLAFGWLFPNALIYIYFFFPMKAKYLVILYGAFELYNGIANNPGDNVAHFAHLGGMLVGFILIKIWDVRRPNQF